MASASTRRRNTDSTQLPPRRWLAAVVGATALAATTALGVVAIATCHSLDACHCR